MKLPNDIQMFAPDLVAADEHPDLVEAIVRYCAKIAAKNYIPGHSVAGPDFARAGALDILRAFDLEELR